MSRPILQPRAHWQAIGTVVGAVALCLLSTGIAQAQAAWEFSPYRVQVWMAWGSNTSLSPQLHDEALQLVQKRAETTFGAVWHTEVSAPPASLRTILLTKMNDLTFAEVESESAKTLTGDKLFVVSVTEDRGSFRVQSRELDCRSREWGPQLEESVSHLDAVPLAAWDLIVKAFLPVVKIETVDGKTLTARLRAGGLITSAESPASVFPEDVLRPIIRRNDRAGNPLPSGIQSPDWTVLRVLSREQSKLICELASGYRYPIPTKGGQRTERFAILIRQVSPSTRLVLQSRSQPPRPLSGYQIFGSTPSSTAPQLLGATDVNGAFVLPATDGRLQSLLVRSGSQLLARLPLVPGQAAEMTATVIDDRGRLQAEGFVLALQSRVMDLVARRELLAARFRARLAAGKLDEAQSLLEEYRLLETRADLGRVLTSQQQQISSTDRTTQVRIERLFSDARQLLQKFLDPETANAMARDLAVARSKPAAAKGAKTSVRPAAPAKVP